MKVNEPPIEVAHVFDHSKETVWKAITERDQMVQWFFDNIPEFRAYVGFKTRFTVKAPSRDFIHLWEITEAVPHERLVYGWKYEGITGDSFVIWTLDEVEGGTKLTLTTRVVQDFEDGYEEFKRESCMMGWNYFIKERLANYLSG